MWGQRLSQLSSVDVVLLLQDELAKAQTRHQEAISRLEEEKQAAVTAQEHGRQQLAKKSNALAASQMALADATAAANDAAKVSARQSVEISYASNALHCIMLLQSSDMHS